MRWENALIILAILGIIIVYFWPSITPVQNVTNNTNKPQISFDYVFIADEKYGTRMCPYEYPSYNSAILVNENGTPLNNSLVGQFMGVNGSITTRRIPTCTCDSFLSKLNNCTVGEKVYQNETVLVAKNYKLISNSSIYSCNSNSDCVPATCCHPKVCINKAFAPNCKNTICTDVMTPNTLDYGKCECINNTCEAVINWTTGFH